MPALYLNTTLSLLTAPLSTPLSSPIIQATVSTTHLPIILTLIPAATATAISLSLEAITTASLLPTIAASAGVSATTTVEGLSTESVVAIVLGIPTLLITGAGMLYKRLGLVRQCELASKLQEGLTGSSGISSGSHVSAYGGSGVPMDLEAQIGVLEVVVGARGGLVSAGGDSS